MAQGLQSAAWLEDRRVLNRSRYDLQVSAEIASRPANRGVVRLSGAGGEDYLLRVCVDEAGYFFAGCRYVLGNHSAEGVHRARVPVALAEKRQHDVTDLGGYPGRGVVI